MREYLRGSTVTMTTAATAYTNATASVVIRPNPSYFNDEFQERTESNAPAAPSVKLLALRAKIRAQLRGPTRRWRYAEQFGARHATHPRSLVARGWIQGKWMAFSRTWGGIHGSVERLRAMPAFLRTLPPPDKLSVRERDALLSLYGETVRFVNDRSREFSTLTYTVRDVTGHLLAYESRNAGREAKAKGFFVNEKERIIVRVPKDEWSKWPRAALLRCTGYKQFSGGTDEPLMPWADSSSDTVVTPITKKLLSRVSAAHAIAGYHNTMGRGYIELDVPPSDAYTFGCEIEIMPGRAHSREAAAVEILADLGNTLDIERDGSVPNGFEIVTGFGSFEALDKAVRVLYERFLSSRHGVYRTSSTTGLHVHVGRQAGIPSHEIVAMAQLEGLFPKLMSMLVGREPNRYCHRMHPPSLGVPPALFEERARINRLWGTLCNVRYSSFNATGWEGSDERRFEWRAPKSTTSYAAWRSRLELIQVMLKWAADDLLKTKVPTIDDFLTRIMDSPRDDTVGLRRALKTAQGGRILTELDATVPVAYNGRREYSALNV